MLFSKATSAINRKLVNSMRLFADESMTMNFVTEEMSFARQVSERDAYFHRGILEEISPTLQICRKAQLEHTRDSLAKVR
jgi:polar amino acid transport system ATP-binding protein